ncbi:MAG: hypothetical protein DSZ00_05300, partial [Gammaproteobacteria bacterium]
MNWTEQREQAKAVFEANGFPGTKEELWRFTDVSPLANAKFSSDWKPANLEFQPLEGSLVAVFENGRLSREKSSLGDLPAGVRMGSILDFSDPRIGTLAETQS